MTDDNVTEMPGTEKEEVSGIEELERLSDVLDTVFGQLAEAAVSPDGRVEALGAISRLNKELKRRQAALDELKEEVGSLNLNKAREIKHRIARSLCDHDETKEALIDMGNEVRDNMYGHWVDWIWDAIEEAANGSKVE